MLALVNSSKYGLGVSFYSADVQGVKTLVSQFDEGSVFINSIVKSDPRLPFGGTKSSGFGRELGEVGFLNFVNHKTVYVGSNEK
jgi:succinate-semialdehyde dehydrogenase/glutarate-semialdehyde dehydrogenase